MTLRKILVLLAFYLLCGNSHAQLFSSTTLGFSPQATLNSQYINVATPKPILVSDISITYIAAPAASSNTNRYKRTINVRVKSQSIFSYNELPLQSPIVIYSHGGSPGNAQGHVDHGQEWTDALAQAGFITINIGHPYPKYKTQLIATCAMANIDFKSASNFQYQDIAPTQNTDLDPNQFILNHNSDCAQFQANMVLRIRDVKAVVDRISTDLADQIPSLLHQWNNHLVLMGHSSGSAPAMSFAGATRTLIDPANTYTIQDPTIFDAYIALSPQSHTSAPHVNGFEAKAWYGIEQPFLMITGEQDSTGSLANTQLADDRKIPYNKMPTGDKYLLWLKGKNSGHSEMNLKKWNNPRRNNKLAEQYHITKQTVIRFLDIYTRNKPNLILDENYVRSQSTGTNYTDLDFSTK